MTSSRATFSRTGALFPSGNTCVKCRRSIFGVAAGPSPNRDHPEPPPCRRDSILSCGGPIPSLAPQPTREADDAMTFSPYDRPVRAAFVGLGRIYDLNVRAYVDNPDVEVVALVDPSEERRTQRQADWPSARTFGSTAELSASGLEVDAVEALLPVPLHV